VIDNDHESSPIQRDSGLQIKSNKNPDQKVDCGMMEFSDDGLYVFVFVFIDRLIDFVIYCRQKRKKHIYRYLRID
jgi:hypothetical protein